MKININKKRIDFKTVKIGDIVSTLDGTFVLICKDSDNADFRGVDLSDNIVTDYYTTIVALLNFIQSEYGGIDEIIPNDLAQISRV